MVNRYYHGEKGMLSIVANHKSKYYTLYDNAELADSLERIEETRQRLVLSLTPGELETMMKHPSLDLFKEAK